MFIINNQEEPSEFEDGDIVIVNLSPAKGHEQRSPQTGRPALVVSIGDLQRLTNMVWVVPITSTSHQRSLSVDLNEESTLNGTYGQILISQLRSIDPQARHIKKVDECDTNTLVKVHEVIDMILHK